jgi:hypothetical protein
MESDHEESYPTLLKKYGNPLMNSAKRILSVTTTRNQDGSSEVLYLVSF